MSSPQRNSKFAEISNSISASLSYFESVDYVFEFEKERYYEQNPISNTTGSILMRGLNQRFASLHPTYSQTKISLLSVFGSSNFLDIDQFSVSTNVCSSHYLYLRAKNIFNVKTAWLLSSSFSGKTLYFNETDKTVLVQEVNISANGKTLTAYYEGANHTFKIKNPKQKDFMNKIKDDNLKSYQKIAYCFLSYNNNFPSINDNTSFFYKSIVEDPQYLYLITCLSHVYQDASDFYRVWIKASNVNIKLLLPLVIYSNFNFLAQPSLVLRANNFLSSLLTTLMRLDENFLEFNRKMFKVDCSDPIKYFLDAFDEIIFSNFTKFVLSSLFIEAMRKFPGSLAGYLAISGVLFLRVMSREMIDNGVDTKTINVLRKCFNFETESDVIQKLKSDIRTKIVNTAPFEYTTEPLSTAEIELLIQRAYTKKEEFLEVTGKQDFVMTISKFKDIYRTELYDEFFPPKK